MLCGFLDITHAHLAIVLAAFRAPGAMFWLYFSGSILLVIGLAKVIKDELPQRHGLDKILPFGRLFLAIPLAVFGTEHLIQRTSPTSFRAGFRRTPFGFIWWVLL